jgi:hypothetical protein
MDRAKASKAPPVRRTGGMTPEGAPACADELHRVCLLAAPAPRRASSNEVGEKSALSFRGRHHRQACLLCVAPSSPDCSRPLSHPCDVRTASAGFGHHLILKCPGSAKVREERRRFAGVANADRLGLPLPRQPRPAKEEPPKGSELLHAKSIEGPMIGKSPTCERLTSACEISELGALRSAARKRIKQGHSSSAFDSNSVMHGLCGLPPTLQRGVTKP